MTKEEVKQEILNNDEEQTKIIINAQFLSLNEMLVKKGILTVNDIEELQTLTNKYIDLLNDKLVDKVLEQLKEWED